MPWKVFKSDSFKITVSVVLSEGKLCSKHGPKDSSHRPTAQCPLTIRRRIRSFSMRSCSFFCSRSVLAWCIIMALFNLPILPWMLRWNSLNSLACCSTLFRYSWCTQNVHHTLISKATQLHFTLEHKSVLTKNRWLFLC